MTDPSLLRRFFLSGALLVGGGALARAASLGAGVLAARLLEPGEFGRLALLQAGAAFASGLAVLGLGLSLSRHLAAERGRPDADAGRTLGSALLLSTVVSAVVAVAVVLCRRPIAELLLGDRGASAGVVAGAGTIVATQLVAVTTGALLGLQNYRAVALGQAAHGLLSAVGLAAGAGAGELTAAVAGFTIGNLAAAAVAVALLRCTCRARRIAPRLAIDWGAMRPLLRLGLPAFISFVVVSSAVVLGQTVLSRIADGYSQLAVFSIANRWHLAILFIPSAVVQALLPAMTGLRTAGERAGVRRLFWANMAFNLAATVPPAMLLIALAGPVLGLSGEYYQSEFAVLVILGVATVPSMLNSFLSTAALSANRVTAWVISDVVLSVVLIGGAVALSGPHGATGLATAYLGGYAASALVLAVSLVRRPPWAELSVTEA